LREFLVLLDGAFAIALDLFRILSRLELRFGGAGRLTMQHASGEHRCRQGDCDCQSWFHDETSMAAG
jgi:hypothetical protein